MTIFPNYLTKSLPHKIYNLLYKIANKTPNEKRKENRKTKKKNLIHNYNKRIV